MRDLAEGWGEAAKLQIPHFVQDDNSKVKEDKTCVAEVTPCKEKLSSRTPIVPQPSKAKTA
jgi:hypothetical protein